MKSRRPSPVSAHSSFKNPARAKKKKHGEVCGKTVSDTVKTSSATKYARCKNQFIAMKDNVATAFSEILCQNHF